MLKFLPEGVAVHIGPGEVLFQLTTGCSSSTHLIWSGKNTKSPILEGSCGEESILSDLLSCCSSQRQSKWWMRRAEERVSTESGTKEEENGMRRDTNPSREWRGSEWVSTQSITFQFFRLLIFRIQNCKKFIVYDAI
ncbi:hypothetical protein PMAYCL1PPCAC_23766 [Pristionchus mayeri]|uniref:Uncharacterized protein n=1 Tax=Pristionchus mayeri TaxID=1317129 RepID=A0AAN5CYU5_9BILA|nr:hypothetical protein PMAYCL1PPCAC_23766 [Pristionchus mayeri]